MLKALFTLASIAFASASITDCGGPYAAFQISKLVQNPDTYMSPGTNVTLSLTYNVPIEITGGTATTSASLNGLPLTPTTEDLCSKVACPIAPGEHNGDSWFTFPSGVSGKITSQVVWRDSAGTELLCLNSVMKTTSEGSSGARDAPSMGEWMKLSKKAPQHEHQAKVIVKKHLRGEYIE